MFKSNFVLKILCVRGLKKKKNPMKSSITCLNTFNANRYTYKQDLGTVLSLIFIPSTR